MNSTVFSSGGPQYEVRPGRTYTMQTQGSSPWVYVPDVKDIFRVFVQPGQTVWVMSQNEPVFAVRTADRIGLVETALYRFAHYDPETAPPAGAA